MREEGEREEWKKEREQGRRGTGGERGRGGAWSDCRVHTRRESFIVCVSELELDSVSEYESVCLGVAHHNDRA